MKKLFVIFATICIFTIGSSAALATISLTLNVETAGKYSIPTDPSPNLNYVENLSGLPKRLAVGTYYLSATPNSDLHFFYEAGGWPYLEVFGSCKDSTCKFTDCHFLPFVCTFKHTSTNVETLILSYRN